MHTMEHRLTDTICSILLTDANVPASLSVPNNTDADTLRPKQGQKKKKRRKKKKKKSTISTQEIEAEPTSHPAHEAVEEATSDSTSLIVNNISSSEPSENDVLVEEAVLNSSVDLAVSKATLATDVSKESYLVKLSLEGDPSKPLVENNILDECFTALTNNSMARRIQRSYRISENSATEFDRRILQRRIQIIANYNWKYFDAGFYPGSHDTSYWKEIQNIRGKLCVGYKRSTDLTFWYNMGVERGLKSFEYNWILDSKTCLRMDTFETRHYPTMLDDM